jgi:transposase
MGVKAWTLKYVAWIEREVHFLQPAQEATLLDYFQEVEHMAARMARLDLAIEEAVKLTPPKMRAVIEALQALRGIAQISAVTIVAELGEVSRFTRARQLMGCGHRSGTRVIGFYLGHRSKSRSRAQGAAAAGSIR